MTQKGTYNHPDLFIAFNSGIHCFPETWVPTIMSILNTHTPLCLTSHDREDQKKQEQFFSNLLDSIPNIQDRKIDVLIPPMDNPFFCYRLRPRTTKQMMSYNSCLFVVVGLQSIVYTTSPVRK